MFSDRSLTLMASLAPVAFAAPAPAPQASAAAVKSWDASNHHWAEQYAAPGTAPQNTYNTYQWDQGATPAYEIHRSCNATETQLLEQGLAEMAVLAAHARDHIYRYGNSSSYYLKYFGDAPTGEPAGWLDSIVNADKAGVLFRCDDIDGNCHQDGWAGHWRGENATDETVICEMSFTSRWPLAGLCGYGYHVAAESTTSYFASDLMHRVYHTTKLGQGVVGHYADTYQECLQLAIDSPEEAVRNSATLRYFALDVYAYDIAVPGEGCTGEPGPEEEEDSHGSSSSSTSSAAASSTTSEAAASTVSSAESMSSEAPMTTSASAASAEATEASSTTSADVSCHTHDGGEVHCVEESHDEDHDEDHDEPTAAAQSTDATTTSSGGAECHTHANGEEHCV